MTDESGARADGPQGSTPWPLNRRDLGHRSRLHLPSTKKSINVAVRDVLEVAECCGLAEDGRTDLEIALREALANAVIHGNAYSSEKSVFVRCYASPKVGLLVLVRDEGGGFDPKDVPDPRDEDRVHLHHGRGLFLMRALVDFVQHRKNGREVVLFKALSDATEA